LSRIFRLVAAAVACVLPSPVLRAVETEARVEAEDRTESGVLSEITSSWWDEDARRKLLAKAGLSESNFVAACVGKAKIVCCVPANCCDEAVERIRLRVLRQQYEREREFRHRFSDGLDVMTQERLCRDARDAFDRSLAGRDDIVRLARRHDADSLLERIEIRRQEERERLERLTERVRSEFGGARAGGRDADRARALEAVCAELRARGLSDTTVEIFRLERELRFSHHEGFAAARLGDDVRQRLEEEVRTFERWLDGRVAADRKETIRQAQAPRKDSLRPPRPSRPSRAAVRQEAGESGTAGKKEEPTPDRLQGILVSLAAGAVVLAVLVVIVCKWCRLARLVERQNAFRRRYEAGAVSRPLGDSVCWFCGERVSGARKLPGRRCVVGVCADCGQALTALTGLANVLVFLCAVAVFCVSAYVIYWTPWCGESAPIACVTGGALAVISYRVTYALLFAGLWRLVCSRLACRDNLEYELAARAAFCADGEL